MDRRQFLTFSGIGAAGLAVGGGATGWWEHRQEQDRREAQDRAGDGQGAEQIVWSVDTKERTAALTFDDGPHPDLTPRVLDVLARRRLSATFFMVGENAVRNPKLVDAVMAGGHEIGNHSWSHGRVVEQASDSMRQDVLHGAASLRSLTGRPIELFRPPRGMVTGEMLRAVAAAHERMVMWSVSRGSPDVRDPRVILAHLEHHMHPGAIIDLHDGTSNRPKDSELLARCDGELAILPAFLDWALADGYRFVTVSTLLRSAASPSPAGG